MDLISRQAAIDEWKNDFKGYINALDMPKDDYKGIMEYIDELPSAQPGWIPCSTALPEHDGEYLVIINALTIDQAVYAEIDIARYKGGKWHKGFPVVAWMPLPKPWEGGQDGV